MDTCPYYHVDPGTVGKERAARACCSHKHSPAPCNEAYTTGSRNLLKCAGQVSQCQIPTREQLDIR
jgi:hypothetical protein